MSAVMNEDQLKALAAELSRDLKSEKGLGALAQQLLNLIVETALNAELEEHLGYGKHDPVARGSGNSRTGTTPKRLKGQHGEIPLDTPRDRNGTFEQHLVRNGQRGREQDPVPDYLHAQDRYKWGYYHARNVSGANLSEVAHFFICGIKIKVFRPSNK